MLKKSRKFQAIVLVILILLTTSVSCAAAQRSSDIQTMPQRNASGSSANAAYTDIKNSWAYEAISYVLQEGLFEGTSDTTFSPDQTMTHSDFAAVLDRLAGDDTEEAEGSDGSGDLTRQGMAQMLCEYAESIGFSMDDASPVSFTDSGEIDGDAVSAINSVISLGLMSGKKRRFLSSPTALQPERKRQR